MSLFAWKAEYSVNNDILDDHHRKMFFMLNSVYENVMNSPEVDCVLPTIDELTALTCHHFATEEQYMKEKGFPGIVEHVAKHREFTHTIESLRANYHNNDLEVSRDLIIVLGEWLLRHVLKEDRKYAALSTDATERTFN